ENIETIRNMGKESRRYGNYQRRLGWYEESENTPRSFLYTIIQFTISGKGMLKCKGREYIIGRGDGFMVHSSDRTASYQVASEEEDWQFIYLELYGENARRFVEELQRIIGPIFKLGSDSEFFRRFNYYGECLKAREKMSLAEQSELINLLRQELLMGLINERERLTLAEKVIDLVEQNRGNFYNIQQLGKHFGVSREYLTREFRKEMNEAPYGYILRRKLEQAFELLATKEFTVQEVAEKLGFSSSTVLGRQFKKHYNYSPRKIL
ncbi:MAG: AraC family transcriptional regulator, partial [Lentisphaeria bacterium]